MDDVDLLGQALEALKAPAVDTHELQSRIAARLAEVYAAGGPSAAPAGEPGLDATHPTLPVR
jgi:hypothetical protein